jgi:uncharacterized protein YprB with RNaseH-like and TPR domain
MYTQAEIKSLLYFDLETAGRYSTFEEVEEKDPRLAQLFRKRCKDYLFQKEANEDIHYLWENNAGLHPEFGMIVCASFGYFDDKMEPKITSYYGENELEILTTARKLLNKCDREGYSLCGHYIKGFDIPYLAKRMIINGMMPPKMIQTHNKKPWEVKHLDTKEMWTFGSYGQSFGASLDLLTCVLGIESPKDKMDGSKVHGEFWVNKNVKGIMGYCEKDVISLMRVMKHITELG